MIKELKFDMKCYYNARAIQIYYEAIKVISFCRSVRMGREGEKNSSFSPASHPRMKF